MSVRLSIIVPTRQRRETLEHVLPTLVRQSCDPSTYEILVCDYASTDGTADLVASCRAPHLRYVAAAAPGRAAGRNAGLRLAAGDIVLFSDADILADHRLVEEHLSAHRRHGPAAIVGWEVMVDSLEDYRACLEDPARRGRLHPSWKRRLSWLFFITGNASAPRDALLRVGGFDETFAGYGHEDLELGYRLSRSGLPIRHHPEAVNFHWHPHTFAERCEKMRLSGMSTMRFYRKHRDLSILARLGVNPVSVGLHACLPSDGAVMRGLGRRVETSRVARSIVLQHAYLSGVAQARAQAGGWEAST